MAALLPLGSGCATLRFDYEPEVAGVVKDRGGVSVGEVRNALGFGNPNRVRENVLLDRPVGPAVREALIAELKQAGFQIGESARRVSAVMENAGFDRGSMKILFDITALSSGKTLYQKRCEQALKSSSIWDAAGFAATVRACLVQFVRDPEAQEILAGRSTPTIRAAPAHPAPTAPSESLAHPPATISDADVPRYSAPEDPDAYAVVVGVEKYHSLPEALYAERDARAVRDHFAALGVPQRHIAMLTGAQASRAGLAKTIETWLARNTDARSTVYFYYSGHGAPDPRTGKAYLVPADGDPQYLEDTGYPLERLYQKLGALPARRMLVMLDSCFSGAGGRSVLAKGTRPLVTVMAARPSEAGKVAVLSASAADEISGAHEEQPHGLFTYYLLTGLNGAARGVDGRVTLRSLYDYLSPKVQDTAKRANRDQSPQLLPASGQDPSATVLR